MVYLTLLGVDFGNKYPAIILTLFFGCMIGLSIGVIIGAIPKLTEGSKIGISVGIGMVLSVLADLCANGIKDMVEHKLPIANRLNPACLISDCFYSLNVYDSYDRFFRNISIMAVESVILLIIAFVLLRREKNMQVFKSYFKKYSTDIWGQMIMYLSIFIGVMVVLTATRTNKAEDDYEATKPKFAVFDYDKSSESKALTEYLKKTCIKKKNIKNDKKETMQDELFARNVNCVLIIKRRLQA